MPVTAGSVKHGAERGVACVDDEDDGPTMKARDGHPKVELSCRERDGDKRERVTQTNHKLLPPAIARYLTLVGHCCNGEMAQ